MALSLQLDNTAEIVQWSIRNKVAGALILRQCPTDLLLQLTKHNMLMGSVNSRASCNRSL